MPCGRIAASPYTVQCVAKLRVVRQGSGPLSIQLLVNFLVAPEISEDPVGRGRSWSTGALCTILYVTDNFLVAEAQVAQSINITSNSHRVLHQQPYLQNLVRRRVHSATSKNGLLIYRLGFLAGKRNSRVFAVMNLPNPAPPFPFNHPSLSQKCTVRPPTCGNWALGLFRMGRRFNLYASRWDTSALTRALGFCSSFIDVKPSMSAILGLVQ